MQKSTLIQILVPAVVASVVSSAVVGVAVAKTTAASAKAKAESSTVRGATTKPTKQRCDYTTLRPAAGPPVLGKRGEVSYPKSWKAILSKGFWLHSYNEESGLIIFERCDGLARR